ncbi:hypothetical protein [Asticcacaulis excentricus]|uniref:Uncharacterized protein n=1 Tax=Asticcacaulis excentricus (strain ATCC 15261 / DSM 4724 / KCTC 12464 / NCIMB 9791 / VKM B-1370 / CB 48) TaxID=573065 RepID=E8RUH7_ASTEC|nr:hypothetical protein [Asticcacaulis excentricus]ADU14065.1 hypothetical protein Astex_2413 [Asticcacaulis excentricus CB 48]
MTFILLDDCIIDQTVEPPGRYPLREVVDPYCLEYSVSLLTDEKRRAIFEAIGSEALAEGLERIYAAAGSFDEGEAAQTIRLAEWHLYNAHWAG